MSRSEAWRPGQPPTGDGTGMPLPVLPAFPGVPGYVPFAADLGALGFRHAAEVLRPPAPAARGRVEADQASASFLVLDGLWMHPVRGHLWRKVDADYLEECRNRWSASGDERAPAVAALLRAMRGWLERHRMALRRVVLYQLTCALIDGTDGRRPTPQASAAEALGVHSSEAAAVAAAAGAAVRGGFPRSAQARQAAEEIVDVWEGGRLYRAARLAAALPSQSPDHELTDLLGRLQERRASVERLMDDAARLERQGRPRAAAGRWLEAVRGAVDEPRAWAGLLGAAVLEADALERGQVEPAAPALPPGGDQSDTGGGLGGAGAPQAPAWWGLGDNRVRVHSSSAGVRLSWRGREGRESRGGGDGRHGGAPVRCQVVRFAEGHPEEATEVPVHTSGTSAYDSAPPAGRPLRYAVIPLRGEHPAGVPRATTTVLLTPEVDRPMARPVPEGVALRWRAHPEVVEVRLLRGRGRGEPPSVPVSCDTHGAVDAPLPPGEYRYLVSCGYRAADGDLVWSPGRTVSARAEEWPSPVPELTAQGPGRDGSVRLFWSAPERGAERLVPWRSRPVAVGDDVSALVDLPAGPEATGGLGHAVGSEYAGDAGQTGERGPDGAGRRTRTMELVPPPGTATRITAVSVLGGRAVAGPTVIIETPGTVRDLEVTRLEPHGAEVRFTWPEPSVLVLLGWEQDGIRQERRVARSEHRAGPLHIPVGRDGFRVTVAPVPRPDASIAVAGVAEAVLPALPEPMPIGIPEPVVRGVRRVLQRHPRLLRALTPVLSRLPRRAGPSHRRSLRLLRRRAVRP